MILTMEEARDALRVDGEDNDSIIGPLVTAIPDYIETCTGIVINSHNESEPLIRTLAKFVLQLWYNPDGTDSARLQVVIDNLIKTLKANRSKYNQ